MSTPQYVHHDQVTGAAATSASDGTLVNSTKFLAFGDRRNSQGNLGTDKLFTGQRLDGTGLYYYGARYYDPGIGRFISADPFVPNPKNSQFLNRYSYVLNNPLKYTDPSGNWPDLPQLINSIKAGVQTVVSQVKQGVQVAVSKTVETYQTGKEAITETYESTKQTVLQKAGEIKQAGAAVIQETRQTVESIPGKISKAAGVESMSTLNTSLVQDVPVINLREGSVLDWVIPGDTTTIYPLGVFTSRPMDRKTQEEEGAHWADEKFAAPVLPAYYIGYGIEYAINYVRYGLDSARAHDAVSFEQTAMDYADWASAASTSQ